jgi:uncharacterized repeat protein (TIGR03803 family)
MTHAKIVASKTRQVDHSQLLLTNAAVVLIALTLAVAAGTAASAQTVTDLYSFNPRNGSVSPEGLLAQGRDGSWYGTTYFGGRNNVGSVYKVTPQGTQTVLYNFDGVHGTLPQSGLTLGADGDFYGTTYNGGANHYGTVFKITRSGRLTTLYSFSKGEGLPMAAPIQGADGNFYGTTGYASAYKITPSGTYTWLGSLPGSSSTPLFQGRDGNFYGTTYIGGTYGYGTVFELTRKGIVTVIYNFDSTHGNCPYQGPLIQDGGDGSFYGTTVWGGAYDGGVAFKLTPQGDITVLHEFQPASADGYNPYVGLVQATDGNFYGTTPYGGTTGGGTIFQITAADVYSLAYTFDFTYGALPLSTPMQHTNGKIYGTATAGGVYGYGAIYSFDLGLTPFVSLVSSIGKAGKSIGILGEGFNGATDVSFNGTPAIYIITSDTFLKAIVPSGATTGFVTVTTPSGTLTSNKQFQVSP